MEQTKLQKIVEQKAEQMRGAIEQAIDEGAKIERCKSCSSYLSCCIIDGVYVQKETANVTISVVLNFKSEKIAKVFEPSKNELAKLADKKRKELEEIERQLNERAKE